MSFSYPKNVVFECTKCAICCGDTETRTRHILLLTAETRQISKAISKPIEDFARKIEGHDQYIYEMKKTEKEGRCVFLNKNKCTIYRLRPLICRFYPFRLETTDGKYIFSMTNECHGIGTGNQLRKDYFESLFKYACGRLRKP